MSGELFRYLGSTPCDCGRCRRVETERVKLTPDLASAVEQELAGAPAILFGDRRTLEACGDPLAIELQASGGALSVVNLQDDRPALHADWQTVERVRGHLEQAPEAVPLAVGSGTINDLVKAAAHEIGRPYLSVATAPSMNGYTSAIASITRDGLKRSLPARPPVAVLASPVVLAESPRRMAFAGLADLLSKPVSSADWYLAHRLWDEPHCRLPAELAGRAVDRAVAVASGLAAGDRDASAVLFEALLLSGISMAVAGSSSPASGGEHLISHYLDMTAAHAPGGRREPALHGEQVGVATRVSTRLYLALLSRPADRIDWDRAARVAPDTARLPELLDAAPWIPDPLRRQFMEQGARKLERLGPPETRVTRIRELWDDLRRELQPDIRAAEDYLEVLPSIEAPVTAAAIGVDAEELRLAYRLARWVRDRYTVLDLAGDLGLSEELESEALSTVV